MAEATGERTAAQEIVGGLRTALEELSETRMTSVRKAEDRGEKVEDRYWIAREELESSKTRLRELRGEYERLPVQSHRERMRGEEAAEAELNERYRDVEAEIPQVEVTIERLAAELDELAPGSTRVLPEAGVPLVSYADALEAAVSARSELESLQRQIRELMDEHVSEIRRRHESLSSFVDGLNQRVSKAYREAGYESAAEVPSHAAD